MNAKLFPPLQPANEEADCSLKVEKVRIKK